MHSIEDFKSKVVQERDSRSLASLFSSSHGSPAEAAGGEQPQAEPAAAS